MLVLVFALVCAIPVVSIDVDAVTSSSAVEFLRVALYFIPVATVGKILTITMGLWIFRVIIAIVKTLWDVLPFA